MGNEDFSKLNKTNFKVPDGYFESVEDRIMSRLAHTEEANETGRIIQLSSGRSKIRKIVITAMAAAACLTFVIFYNNNSEVSSYDLSTLENTEIINFLNENADDVELDFLVSKTGNAESALDLLEPETFNIDQDELIDDINIDELY